MANIQQQKKRVRIAARERAENLRYRSTVKMLMRRLETAVEDGDADAISTQHREVVRWLDRAASRGALHKNTTGRRKAQAARLVGAKAVTADDAKAKKPAGRKKTAAKPA
ncbi:MAG: 30S ribosomal protein S20 [Gaiellaceae bacterium]